MFLSASRDPPEIVIRYVAEAGARLNDDYSQMIRDFLTGPHAEAVSWLQGGAGRTLGELQSHDQSLFLVNRFYALGAQSVIAVELDPDGEGCRHLLIQLPRRDSLRDAIFAFERAGVEDHGFDGTPDEGQEYLFVDVKNFSF
jgi:hypothetical protein